MSISAEAGSSCDDQASTTAQHAKKKHSSQKKKKKKDVSPPRDVSPDGDGSPAGDGRQQQQTPPRGKSLTLTILMRNCELSSTIIGGICDPRPKYE